MKNIKKTKIGFELVLFLLMGFFIIIPSLTKAAVLYLMPQSQSIYQGDSFLVEVRLNTEGKEINAVEVNLKFPPDLLKILDFSKGGSVLTLWPSEIHRGPNSINFIGGVPGGFKGDGEILKINFFAKELGKAKINFQEDSKVLLNDGKATPAKLNFLEANYEIVLRPAGLPVLTSPSNPDQNKWYSADSFEIHWQAKPDAEYSYILSRDPLMEPDEKPEKLVGHLKWEKMEDGIYYFHLKEKLPGKDWSDKLTYRFMIDTTSPEDFTPQIAKDPSVFEGKYFLNFATTDKISGIDHYEVKEGKGDFKRAQSPYLLKDQSLQSIIEVKAVDKAGNERIAKIVPSRKPFPYLLIILILIGVAIIWWLIKKLKRKSEKL